MPLYEYKCEDCGKEFEEIMSSTSVETPDCPECKSEKVVKLVSACSFDCGATRGGMDLPTMPTGGGCSGGSGFS